MTMKWDRLLSTKRLCAKRGRKPFIEIQPFDEDQDSIIFSQPFRRMQAKTQVHPLSDNDHVRTRLTHSLEVSMIGYVLGYKVAEKLRRSMRTEPSEVGSLMRAACLAHDIGNPPFGHTGEDAIRDWARKVLSDSDPLGVKKSLSALEQHDLVSFDGNAQGFRILTQTENYRWNGGLHLTCGCLGAFMKYPWSSAHDPTGKGKFNFFQSERDYARTIAEEAGMKRIDSDRWARHPLVWLVEAADDICYAFVDLEDGIEMGSFTFRNYEQLFGTVVRRRSQWNRAYKKTVVPMADRSLRTSYIRSKLISSLVAQVVDAFCDNRREIMNGTLDRELLDLIPDRALIRRAKKAAKEKVFKHSKKLYVEVAAYEIIGGLLDAFGDACFRKVRDVRTKEKHLKTLMGVCWPEENQSPYSRMRRIIDFVSGMTDRFALGMYRQISGISSEGMTPAPTTS